MQKAEFVEKNPVFPYRHFSIRVANPYFMIWIFRWFCTRKKEHIWNEKAFKKSSVISSQALSSDHSIDLINKETSEFNKLRNDTLTK